MARILGIDYGGKKTGISTTDPLQIIVTGIGTVPTVDLFDYLVDYCDKEAVEKIVIGRPTHKDGKDTYLVPQIIAFRNRLQKKMPEMLFDFADETLSSVQARSIILQSGVKKSKRRDKTLVDKVSAVIILQRYLNHI